MALIGCNQVSFSYENTGVIKNLSFEVNEGDYPKQICLSESVA